MRHFGMPPGYDRYKLATPPEYDDAFFGIEPEEEEEFYVGCGSFESPAADGEYYIARRDDGTVLARGLLEDNAYALCAQMNAGDEEEPLIEEEPGVTTVTMPNSKQYFITEITAGAFVGDYQIAGPGFYSDGHPSMDAAVSYLLAQEWQSL